MENLNILEKLDAVLTFIIANNEGEEVFNFGREHYDEFKELLEKLAKDGYTKRVSHDESNHVNIPTVEGRIFNINGGYVKQKAVNDLNQIIAETNERVALRNDTLLVRWTCFAGIAALLLFLWQIFLYFYPVHSNYTYWIWETIPKRKP